MIYEPLKTVLRIYDDISKQNRYLKNGRIDTLFPLLSPSDGVLPWQMRVAVSGSGDFTFTKWKIINAIDDIEAYDFTGYINQVEHNRTGEGFDYFLHHGVAMQGVAMAPGSYYMALEINSHTYYSEVFCVTNCLKYTDLSPKFLRITWDNECGDLGPILFQTGWRDLVYLDTHIEKEEPSIYEEGTEDAYKDFVPTLRKYVDNLALEANVAFFLVEALVIMSMANNVVVITQGSVYSGQIRNIKTAVQQQPNGNIYTLIAKFQQDTIYVNNACCSKMQLVPPPASGGGGSGGSGGGSGGSGPVCIVPDIQATGLANAQVGQEYVVPITVTGTKPLFLSVQNKPVWMDISLVDDVVYVSGTPSTAISNLPVKFTVFNSCGADTLETTINTVSGGTTGQVTVTNQHPSATVTSADPDKFNFSSGNMPCPPGFTAYGTHGFIDQPIFMWLGGSGISGRMLLSVNGVQVDCTEFDGPGMAEFNGYTMSATDSVVITIATGRC